MGNLIILLLIIAFVILIILDKDFFPKKILLPIIIGIFCWIPIGVEYFLIETFVEYESKIGWVKSDWAGFLGSYLGGAIGALITLLGVYWQVTRNEKQKMKDELKSLLLSIKYHLEVNLTDKDISYKKFEVLSVLSYTSDSWTHDFSFEVIHSLDEIDLKQHHIEIFKLEYGKRIIDLNRKILDFNKHYIFLLKNLSNKKRIIQRIKENGNSKYINLLEALSNILYNYVFLNKKESYENEVDYLKKKEILEYYLSDIKNQFNNLKFLDSEKEFKNKILKILSLNLHEKKEDNLKIIIEALCITTKIIWSQNLENLNLKDEISELYKFYNSDENIRLDNIFSIFEEMDKINKKVNEDLKILENY